MKRSVVVLLVACGACGDDGGVNTLPDAPAGMASVTIRMGRTPAANRTVHFQGPDGAEIATVQTDSTGTASAVVPVGSSVTALDILALRPNDDRKNVVTVMGVEPGDDIVLTGTFDLPRANVTFTYPTYAGANPQYGVLTNCNNEETGTGTTATRPVPQCSSRVDAMALVVDGFDHAGAFIAKPDQPFGDVDFAAEPWTEITPASRTYTNIETNLTVTSGRFVTTSRGPLFDCREDNGGAGPTHVASVSCPAMPGAFTLASSRSAMARRPTRS